jgi:hypothetical protein
MNDDLRRVSPAFLRLHEDMERISHSLRPSYVDFYEQIERALRPIQQHHLEIAKMAALSDLASARIAEVVKANQHWQGLIEQATASSRVFADLGRMHETWAKSLRPMQDQIAQLQAAAKLSLGGMAYRLTVSERLFAGLDFDAIRRAVAVPELSMLKLRDSITNMTATYGKLAESIRSYPDFTQLPDFALPGATREVFVTGHAVGVLRVSEEPDEDAEASQIQLVTEVRAETSVCIGLLQTLDPGLATPYLGAREALGGGNPDRARHILSSLRELWNHVLRRIAPDEHVLAWVPSGSKELLHEGRPTRKARVLYVCRNLNHAPLVEFIDQDTRALVKLVEFFNRVHELESELTDEQLRALLLRTDSWLTYILQIWEGSR